MFSWMWCNTKANATSRWDQTGPKWYFLFLVYTDNEREEVHERERERWLNSEQRQRKIRRFVVSYRSRCVNWEMVPLPRYGHLIQNYLRQIYSIYIIKFPYYKLAFQFLMGLTLQEKQSYVGFCFLLLSINIGKRKRVLAYFSE